MTLTLDHLEAVVELPPLAHHLGQLVARLDPGAPPWVAVATALAALAVEEGHTCLDLARLLAEPSARLAATEGAPQGVDDLAWPDLDTALALLRGRPVVSDGTARAPLVLRDHRLYLARYDDHEAHLAGALRDLSVAPVPPVDGARLDALVEAVFEGLDRSEAQQAAVRRAVTGRLTWVTGGPGTGKTTTVVRMLAALVDQALARGERVPEVRLLAPTGKAAARLAGSVRRQRDALPVDDAVRAAIPTTAGTIHRALRPRNDWLTAFVHGPDRPWSADLVVLDEVSMVDVPLLARTLDALGPHARLVLVGDPDQLGAVGVGAALADLSTLTEGPVAARHAPLTTAHRFDASGPIGRAARHALDGDAQALLADLASSPGAPEGTWVARVPVDGPAARDAGLVRHAADRWAPWCALDDPEARLRGLDRFLVLCATRRGLSGSEALSAAIEAELSARGLLHPTPAARGRGRPGAGVEAVYPGQPILVRRNDEEVRLYNGDAGVVLDLPGEGLRACFLEQAPDGSGLRVRSVLPSRLPPFETLFATTVHKSQGSEYDEVLLVLPERPAPVLDRELVYTGLTRARERVALATPDAVLDVALSRRAWRDGGLHARLRDA